jgi:hypothetical protein
MRVMTYKTTILFIRFYNSDHLGPIILAVSFIYNFKTYCYIIKDWCIDRIKNKISRCRENSIIQLNKNVGRGKIDTSKIQTHDCSFSWLGTGISINSSRLNSWAKTLFSVELYIYIYTTSIKTFYTLNRTCNKLTKCLQTWSHLNYLQKKKTQHEKLKFLFVYWKLFLQLNYYTKIQRDIQ